MPGITGILRNNTRGDEKQILKKMIQSMMHEPFYNSGNFISEKCGVFAGFITIKDTFPDCQPIYNESKKMILLFSGECFTEKFEINTLKNQGHIFHKNNASYLIHFYEEIGEEFLCTLNGWFSGLLIDLKREKIILFNDRYGIQRIYYHIKDNTLYFSSEAKALLKVLPELRNPDFKSIGAYLSYDCVMDNKTYFKNVHLLPSGSSWIYSKGNLEKKSYFDPSYLENQTPLDDNSFYQELGNTFKRILPKYFDEETITGMALTGGLDTRMILSSCDMTKNKIEAYTYGGMYRDSCDVKIARKVAKELNCSHKTFRLDSQLLNNFASLAEKGIYITDGLANITTFDVIYLDKLARNVSNIKLTGKFGSQVLGRVRFALRDRFPDKKLINEEFKKYISMYETTINNYHNEHRFSFILYKEIPWFWSRFTCAELSQLMVRSPYLDNELVKIIYRAPKKGINGSSFELNYISSNHPALGLITTDKGLNNSNSIFSKLIESKYKTLNIFDKILNWDILPYNLHHWVARAQSLTSPLHLDRLVFGNTFFRHYPHWFKNQLSGYLKEILLDSKTLNRPYWNKKILEKNVLDHIKGKGNYISEIRKVLTLELIHRTLID